MTHAEYSLPQDSNQVVGDTATGGREAGSYRPKMTKVDHVRKDPKEKGCTSSLLPGPSRECSPVDYSNDRKSNDWNDRAGGGWRREHPESQTEGIAGSAATEVEGGSREHELVEVRSKDSPLGMVQWASADDRGLGHTPSRYQDSVVHERSPSFSVTGTVEDEDGGWNLDRSQPASSHHAQGVQSYLLLDLCGLIVLSPGRLS